MITITHRKNSIEFQKQLEHNDLRIDQSSNSGWLETLKQTMCQCIVVILIFAPLQNRLAFFSYGHVTLQWHKTRGWLAYAITELLNFLNTLVNNDLNCIRNT